MREAQNLLIRHRAELEKANVSTQHVKPEETVVQVVARLRSEMLAERKYFGFANCTTLPYLSNGHTHLDRRWVAIEIL